MPKKDHRSLQATSVCGGAARLTARRRRLPPAERREQIIAAARDLFTTRGVDNVSMRKIATRVGITQAAIYQHFEDKAAILFALSEGFFQGMIANFVARLDPTLEPLAAFRASLKAYVEYGLSRPEEYRLVFMTSNSQIVGTGHRTPPDMSGEAQSDAGKIAFSILHDRVRELVETGQIRGNDPDAMAEAIWAAGHGIVSLLITHQTFEWTQTDRLVETQLDLLFYGLLPRG
ncbi:MAG: TetR/AcrR family transcriptional regulator [Parvibaculum sp.]